MEQLVPDWLTKDLLTYSLQKEVDKQNAEVVCFTASPAVPAGNNYGGSIIRVKVEYKYAEGDEELHSLSFIIKSELVDGPLEGYYDLVESTFYYRFIPEARKITDFQFIPKSFSSNRFSTIVLEDLKEEGFVMEDRTKQLDFEHCRLYMETAAYFHAVSFAVHKNHPELIESIGKERFFAEGLKMKVPYTRQIKFGFEHLADVIEGLDTFRKYSKVIRKSSYILWEMLVEAVKPSKVLNTLNQGDPWTTNLMFRYSQDGVVSHLKLLDFQMLRYGSPVSDLVFFVWSSANSTVRRNSLDKLYRIYLETFNNKMEELNCDERLSLETLMENVRILSPLAAYIAISLLPYFLDPSPADFSPFFSRETGENPYKKQYSTDYCNNHLVDLLTDLESTGVFSYLEDYLAKQQR